MPFTPKDISAVESRNGSNSSSILYYVDDNEEITSLVAPQAKGTKNNVTYNVTKIQQVQKNGNKFPVKPVTAKLDAVAYEFGSSHEVRVYYVGDKNNNQTEVNQLLELVNSNGGQGEWTPGALNELNLQVSIGSPISANVADGQGNLKVYYNDQNNKLRVAWVVLGETSWTSSPLTATPGFT